MYSYDRYYDCHPDYSSCRECEIFENSQYEASIVLTSILNQLYDDSPLNLLDLESDLEDLCHQLDIKFPTNKTIKIKRA
jgi:hypothetical protein